VDISAAAEDTVWKRGRFDERSGPGRLLFGRMYEDASIELAAFRPGGRVLCVASAGCTALALAPRHEVIAVDINPVQLAYAERRFAGQRCERGAAEHLMGFGRRLAPLVGWWPSRLHAFLNLHDPAEQSAYWRRYLDTARFRAAFDALLSLTALRRVYAAPFLECLPSRLGAVMRARMERCFRLHSNDTNPYARALLLGELSDDAPAAQARNIRLVHADAAGLLEREPAGSIDGFALSNILDGASQTYRRRLIAAVKRAAAPDAAVVLRSFGEAPTTLATNRAESDRAMLWGIVDVVPAGRLS
jgi:S-adenosylmethionine:diacylglycerol 3-amino-3-carboxypropyl transferase